MKQSVNQSKTIEIPRTSAQSPQTRVAEKGITQRRGGSKEKVVQGRVQVAQRRGKRRAAQDQKKSSDKRRGCVAWKAEWLLVESYSTPAGQMLPFIPPPKTYFVILCFS